MGDTKKVREILQIEIAAKLPRVDAVIGQARRRDKRPFDGVGRTVSLSRQANSLSYVVNIYA
jgi:hypothetical protein